jgi:DNA-directed RNA polymerase II subunit RPB2
MTSNNFDLSSGSNFNKITMQKSLMNTTPFDLEKDPYIEAPWAVIGSYYGEQYLEKLVRHQLESYNNFVGFQLPRTIDMFNPLHICSEDDLDPITGKYALEMTITFENFHIYRPQIHENNGAIKLMFPQEARLRNFTYSSAMTIDMNIKYTIRTGETVSTLYKTLPKIHIGKLPIMVKSSICVLNQHKYVKSQHTGECPYDAGGYFIINGSEKTVLGQEKAAENRVYCFNISKNNTKYSWSAEIKSVPDFKCISPKQINMMVQSKNNGFGFPICIQIPRIKQPVPLFIVFRALGIVTDKSICEHILINIEEDKYQDMLANLQASIIEANKALIDKSLINLTQEDAIKYLMGLVNYMPINMDKETGLQKKRDFTMDVLSNDLLPHCVTTKQKVYFLGYMANRLLQALFGWTKGDDRDSYLNKRIDLTGASLNNLFRNYFNKLVKDMEKQVIREINTGTWRSTEDYANIINPTNIYKIVKSTTIENGFKRALSTGDFSLKNANTNKVGVAQVVNRLTYVAAISHLRRISTPTDKSGKLIPPRKLHNTSWGFLCPAETPEGQSVGVVKNLSQMTHITIHSNTQSLHEYVEPHIVSLEQLSPMDVYDKVKVFVNGAWTGISNEPMELFHLLKSMKVKGIINIYTSIVFDYKMQEIRICNDSGRLTRPLLRVKDGNILLTKEIIAGLTDKTLGWNDLLTQCTLNETVLEYIDPEEQSFSLIATKPKQLWETRSDPIPLRYTHCEIHPSTIFGIVASCIPYPDHNQSPRNTYQCAQAKQAMGVYAMNFNERMDKTAYVANYPTRPLVDTRIMGLLKMHEIPSGCNINVAIMTHTGYNQEDSVLINKGSIDRGLFQTTIYHTEKDEDKQKINGDEEIRCKPDKSKTKGMKFGDYSKVNSKGVVPENSLVENRTIIIAKVTPIKEHRNDPTKVIKFEDQSRIYRTVEETYIDKNYIDRNGDGYSFAKVRLRATRKPVIGDKFCALPTQQVLTNIGWIDIKDIDISIHQVATIDLLGNLTYEYPSNKFRYEHDGDMYCVSTPDIEFVCTLNHRLYVKRQKDLEYGLIEAKEVLGEKLQFQRSLKNVLPDTDLISLPKKNGKMRSKTYSMTQWLQVVGSFLANGVLFEDYILIQESQLDRIKDLNKVFEGVGVQLRGKGCGTYYIYKKEHPTLYWNLKDFWSLDSKGVPVKGKVFPSYCWTLSNYQSRYLLWSILSQDKTNNTLATVVNSIEFANNISKLSVHSGYSAQIKNLETPSSINCYYVTVFMGGNQPFINDKINNHKQYSSKDGSIEVEQLDETFVHYKGKVYCIEMPSSHTYYMRETPFSPSLLIGNSSRHGQKGTVGNIIPEEDMPFTSSGNRPDIIINPHAIPSRMTIGQLKETLLGKVLVELGLFGDGTSFGDLDVQTISNKLLELGYESHGNELMYNGLTGQQIECSVFMGPVFYQRLKHMVNDKQHSRSHGPMMNLTRQPAEGRSRDGGLRFGEMEKDAMVSHGASRFTRERMYDVSDKYSIYVCKDCGLIPAYNDKLHIHLCKTCGNRTRFAHVEIPYACKLLFQELTTMNVVPRLITDGK